MNDLDTLRPEVREAVQELDGKAYPGSRTHEHWLTIRAELLRLADENARLNKIESLATEQRLQMEDVELYLMDVSQPDDEDAPWCDRMKSAIELLVQDCNDAIGQKNKAESELAEMKQTFDLRRRADMRAIEQWRVAHPGNELVMPDHADMCVWLMSELAAVKARIFQGIILDVDDLARGHAGLPLEWRGKHVRLVVEE